MLTEGRSLSLGILLPLAACAGGLEPGSALVALAQYNDGPSTCDGYGVNSAVPGLYNCGATRPVTQSSCPAAQWLWTQDPEGNWSFGSEKGNAYCAQIPWQGKVNWGSYTGPHIAVVQEIAGLWVPARAGCNKNVRVCLGTPTNPAVTATTGATVGNCGTGLTGPGGCAVCASAFFRDGAVGSVDQTCCTDGFCLRHTLAVTMNDGGGNVVSDFEGIDCQTGTCASEYSDLMAIKLTRTDGHLDWTGWSGDCSGTSSACTVPMTGERSVQANYQLGARVTGAVSPADGDDAALRDSGVIVANQAAAISVAMNGSGYRYVQDGVCDCFVAGASGFVCARATAGSGTVTVTHTASQTQRTLDVRFERPRGPAGGHGMGECERLRAAAEQ
jgi:hypothetical protein